ncbi:MAG TPA: hypothetical protein VH539_15055 [Gemmatimonadaceae bacterium]|jgi:hypothetical protein
MTTPTTPTTPTKDILVPAPLAVAMMTGRPELARITMQHLKATATPEEINAVIDQMSAYGEALTREVQQERDNVRQMEKAVAETVNNLKGALRFVERVQNALKSMRNGDDAATVAATLRNLRNPREEE